VTFPLCRLGGARNEIAEYTLMQAEVIGLEEQLTVPSRYRPDLVDLWISIRWHPSETDWSREFNAIAENEVSSLLPADALQVVSLTQQQGWVVARSVNIRSTPPKEIETIVRRLVNRANERLLSPAPIVIAPPPTVSWPSRLRSTLAEFSAEVFGVWPTPRRGRNADVASS
jgi:hypothetical protein